MKVAMSSGHGLKVRGASGYLDEVNEARRVVAETADWLQVAGVGVVTYNDDVSTTQDENLQRIVDWHNSRKRDLDVSVHFNSFRNSDSEPMKDDPIGTEVWYATQKELAAKVAAFIAESGDLIDRGAKANGLYFLSNTEMPAILIEVCFVDSSADASLYTTNFAGICMGIAEAIAGVEFDDPGRSPSDSVARR